MILVVLVVIVLLSLSVYSFAERMLAEAEATAAYVRRVETRAYAESGVEFLKSLLIDRNRLNRTDVHDNPDLFRAVLVHDEQRAARRGCFSIVVPAQVVHSTRPVRFGLIDESSKLNLNSLPLEKRHAKLARQMLAGLPGMTPGIADAILDWLDADDVPREFGAESEYYRTLGAPHSTRNGPLQSLDELLLVRGVTRELLFGEDANQDGWLDPNENDGDATWPPDNADGVLQHGWISMLTLDSRETNSRPNGQPRINLNQQSMSHLFDELDGAFGKTVAQFVVAYRMNGPLSVERDPSSDLEEGDRDAEDEAAAARQRARAQRGADGEGDGREQGTTPEDTERGGMELNRAAVYRIRSLYDLFGVAVQTHVNGVDSVLESPWSDDPRAIQAVLPELSDTLTTSDAPTIEGRISINHAPREVLSGLLGMTPEVVQAITAAHLDMVGDGRAARDTTAWLLSEGLVDMKRLRLIAPYITTHGDVYRACVVGHSDSPGPQAGIEVVVDASGSVPRVIYNRDLPWTFMWNSPVLFPRRLTATTGVAAQWRDGQGDGQYCHSPAGTPYSRRMFSSSPTPVVPKLLTVSSWSFPIVTTSPIVAALRERSPLDNRSENR